MTNSTLLHRLRLLVCGLLLSQILAIDVKDETSVNTGARQLGLEDYMRFTPRPTAPMNETLPAAPTAEPTTRAPTKAPTSEPSSAPTESPTTAEPTKAPSEAPTTPAPTDAVTEAPTVAPSQAPTTLAPTESPTMPPEEEESDVETADAVTTETEPPAEQEEEEPATDETTTTTEDDETTNTEKEAPTDEPTEAVVVEQEAEKEEEKWDLFSETLEYQDSVGTVHVDFSLYSPNITVAEMNYMKLKMGVCTSIDGLVCEPEHPIREEGPEYCAVNDEVLLRDGTAQARLAPEQLADYEVTVLALATTGVKEGSGLVQGQTSIAWTTWRMSWDVLKLGPVIREHIQETHGEDLTEEEITEKGLEMLQQMMSVNMERTLRDGVLQKDINEFMVDIMLLTSVVGEEVETYEPIVMVEHESAVHAGEELETGEDGEGGGLMVVLFFAGLGVACFVIVGLLYFSFRSRRSRIRRKRTIVILDDTDKESSGSQQAAAQAAAVQAANQATGTTQAEPQESSQDKVIVMETQEGLDGDPPRAQKEQPQQQWGDASSVGGTSSVGGPEEAEADVESQWGRSAAQSSAYTGSISAITGVSGLEQSDTWSVGSMSIDLAEWG